MNEPNRRFMTRGQIVQAGALIMAHCKKDPDGLAIYEDGWSDHRVVTEVGIDAGDDAVGRIRRDIVGHLKRATKATDAERIDELEKAVRGLNIRIEALRSGG